MFKLTSIIPIRTQDFDFHAQRLKLRATLDLSGVETIIIDDGSPLIYSEKLEQLCKKLGFKYYYLNTSNKAFSLSRARNKGLDYTTNEWVIMEDVDIVYSNDFYQRIINELPLLEKTPFNFLTIPVIYLKENITNKIFDMGEVDSFIPEITTSLLFEHPTDAEKKNKIVESFAPASALFIAKKSLMNFVGGYDESFVGWGGEDRDIAFRMLACNDKCKFLPSSFNVTKPWNLNKTYDYEGWRSFYRLTGDYLANKGLYGFHLYHPKLEWRLTGNNKGNLEFAKEKANIFYKNKKVNPRYNIEKPVQIIIGYNPYLINRYVSSLFDNLMIIDDAKDQDITNIIESICEIPTVEVITFWNPYGSSWRLELYNRLKLKGFNIVVAERGALPNSYYFDQNGLCIESDSYQNYNLIVKRHEEDFLKNKTNVENYIRELRFGDKALETQSQRIPGGLLRLRLGIEENKKILFCPLQLATDTVTTYFLKENRSYQDYLSELEKLSTLLPTDWVLVVKNHPLATDKFKSQNLLNADNYHINDLIEVADAVVLFNSGCGLISMAFEKKVFYYGKCFYAIDGVNAPFESAEQVVSDLNHKKLQVDMDKVIKFYYFLLFHFYSFAETKTEVLVKNSVVKTRLTDIYYKSIKYPNKKQYEFIKPLEFNHESLIVGRYCKSIYKKLAQKNKSEAPKVKKTHSINENGEINKNKLNSLHVKKDELKIKPNDMLMKKNSLPSRKKLVLLLFCFFATPFLSENKKAKLKYEGRSFFKDSKNKYIRYIGDYIYK